MIKGTAYHIIAMAIFISSSYTIHIVIARHMGPSLYGLFGIVLAVLSVIDLVVRSGVGKAVSKYVSEGTNQFGILRSGLRLQLGVSTIFTLLYFSTSNLIASLLGDKTLGIYIRLSALCIIPYALDSIYHGYLNGLREFGRECVSSILYSVIKLSVVLVVLLTRSNVADIFIGYAVSAGAAVVISRQFGHKFMTNWQDPLAPAKKLIAFAIPVALVSITEVLLMNTDIFLIKRLLHDNILTGLYISATNLARLPWYILGAFYMTLFPSISKAASKCDIKLAKKYLTESLRYLLIVIIPLSFIISVSAPNLLRVFYSDAFVGATPALSVLIFGISLMAVFTAFTGVISASGKPSLSLALSIILLPISLGANFLLIPKYGLLGAAAASTFAYGVGVLTAAGFVFLKFGNCVSILSLSRILIASFGISFFLPERPVGAIILLTAYVIALFAYIGILFLLREITTKDIDILKSMLRQS